MSDTKSVKISSPLNLKHQKTLFAIQNVLISIEIHVEKHGKMISIVNFSLNTKNSAQITIK